MTSTNPSTRVVFTEDEARELLADAIRLQHSLSSGMSLVEIERVAAEVGVGEHAFSAAVVRFNERQLASSRSVGHLPRLLARYAGLGVAGALLTEGLTRAVSNSPQLTGGLAFTFFLLLFSGIAAKRSPRGARLGFLEFQSRNLGLWLGYGATTFVLASAAGPDVEPWVLDVVVSSTTLFWAVSSVIGGFVAAWRSRTERATPEAPRRTGPERIAAFKRQLADRLQFWIDAVLRRKRVVTSPKPAA